MKDKRTYKTWCTMRQRCDNSNRDDYVYYGDKGITYDPRWNSYDDFLADMGVRPEGKTLDRRDSQKGYNKDNCRWSTQQEQLSNRSKYTTNKTGIVGVHFRLSQRRWIANAYEVGYTQQIYRGKDFFEACCARKSWEVRAAGIAAKRLGELK